MTCRRCRKSRSFSSPRLHEDDRDKLVSWLAALRLPITFPGRSAQWSARSFDGGTAYSCGGSPGIAPGSHDLSFA